MPAAPKPMPARGEGRDFGLEEYVLGLLLQSPSTLAEVQFALGEQGLAPLAGADFTAAEHERVWDSTPEALAEISVGAQLHLTRAVTRNVVDRLQMANLRLTR